VNPTKNPIKLDDQEIPWSPEVKYLGLYLDKRLTFASHTAESIKKAERAFRILYSFLNRKPKLCIQVSVGNQEYGLLSAERSHNRKPASHSSLIIKYAHLPCEVRNRFIMTHSRHFRSNPGGIIHNVTIHRDIRQP
jgi:hypothetical protein